MYAHAVKILNDSMGYSPFDIGYDAFYRRHSYFENNAYVGNATTNVPQNKSAEVKPVERPRAMDLAFLVSSNTGCFAEISRCETPSIRAQSANCGSSDPPTPTDSSILTSANPRENGADSVTGAFEPRTSIGNNEPSNSEYSSEYLHGMPVRIKTTNVLGSDVPRPVARQTPKRSLLASHNSTRRLKKSSSQSVHIYACPVCPGQIATKTSVQVYLMSHSAEQTFKCNLCSRQLKLEQRQIISHSKKHLECHICHKVLSSFAGYKMHMESHSGITYECTICNRELLSKSSFEAHMKTHIENRVYECPFCQKKLKYKSTLSEHMRRHTGEKPYECKICHTKKATSQMLRTHMKKHR